MTKYYLILIILCAACGKGYAQELEDINLLQGEEKAEAIMQYVYKHQNDTAQHILRLARQGLQMAQEKDLKKFVLPFKRLLGSTLMTQGNLDSALYWLHNAQKQASLSNDSVQLGETELILGSAYYRKRNLESAIEHWIPAVKHLEKSGKFYSQGVTLHQMGNAFLMLNKSQLGVIYNRKALKVDTILTMDFMLGRIYNSLGYGYDELARYDSAMIYYKKAFEIGERMNDVVRMGLTKINICATYESSGDTLNAKLCLNETIDFLTKNSMYNYLGHVYTTLVNLQLAEDLHAEASHSIDSIKKYLRKYPDREIAIQIPEMESRIYESTGDFEKALIYFKKHTAIQDSIVKASRNAEVEELRIKYETEKKDEKLKATKRENLLKDAQNRKTKILWLASVVALLLLFGLLFFIVNSRLLKRKKEIAESKVSHQLEVIKASIDGQESERKRIAQELHDGIGQQFTAIKMAYESLAEKVDERTEKISGLIENAAQDIRSLSHQMMPRVLQDMGLVDALRDLINSLQTNKGPIIGFTTRNIDERLIEHVEVNLYRICQELLNNALKHANATEINVILYKTNENIILVVDDNGVGAESTQLKGYGYMSLVSRIEALGANYNIETFKDKGLTCTIRIPQV